MISSAFGITDFRIHVKTCDFISVRFLNGGISSRQKWNQESPSCSWEAFDFDMTGASTEDRRRKSAIFRRMRRDIHFRQSTVRRSVNGFRTDSNTHDCLAVIPWKRLESLHSGTPTRRLDVRDCSETAIFRCSESSQWYF